MQQSTGKSFLQGVIATGARLSAEVHKVRYQSVLTPNTIIKTMGVHDVQTCRIPPT